MTDRLRIATRKSALAMWQARHVRDLLQREHAGLEVELVPIVTEGDRILDQPLALIGGKGLFLKELERALLDGAADLAVHSMKDVPADMAPGLAVEVVLPRANPFDAWLSQGHVGLDDLPPGSRVGTSSLRRQSLLLSARPDLEVADLRGNVDTRLRKLTDGQYDAIILASAGLERLGLERHISQVLRPPDWLPAATQGIIGLQHRADDPATRRLLDPLNDEQALVQARCERAVTRRLQATCQVPLAVYAEPEIGKLELHAMVGTPDGTRQLVAHAAGPWSEAEALGEAVAEQLLRAGAGEIIAALLPH